MSLPPVPWLHRFLPLAGRRFVVLDPGSRFLRVLVVDAGWGAPRVVHFQTIEFSAADPRHFEELDARLDELFTAAGPHERILVLPQYRVIAQVVDLPPASAAEMQSAIAREARRLSGLDEASLAFDAVRLKPFGRLGNPHWLTLCKRAELDGLIARFGSLPEGAAADATPAQVAQITTSGQALFAAAPALLPAGGSGVLVDLRANNSVVAIVAHGQGVYTTTLPIGSLQLGEEPAAATIAPPPTAGIPTGEPSLAASPATLEKWYRDVQLSVVEWIEDNPDTGLTLADLPVFVSGRGTSQPAFLEFLNQRGKLRFASWEEPATRHHRWPMADYLVAYGAALRIPDHGPRGVSLLPEEMRLGLRRRRLVARLQTVNVVLLLVLSLCLAWGIWQKNGLMERKTQLTERAQEALKTARSIDALYRRLNLDYEQIYPVLQRQRRTLETLQTLAAVRAARTNDDFWYVLFADANSYQAGPPVPTSPPTTNAPPAVRPPTTTTNLIPAMSRREYILELCVPSEGEALRRILSDVVANLKRNVLFSRVDSLPPERKRDWVDPKVAISNRVFAVAMEVAGAELPRPSVEGPNAPAAGEHRRAGLSRLESEAAPPP